MLKIKNTETGELKLEKMLEGCKTGDLEKIKEYFSSRTDMQVADTRIQQAFHLACSHNQLGIIKYLFEHYINCEINYLKGLQACAEYGCVEIMEFLQLNFKDRTDSEAQKYQKLIASEFENLLEIAQFHEQTAVVKFLRIQFKDPKIYPLEIIKNNDSEFLLLEQMYEGCKTGDLEKILEYFTLRTDIQVYDPRIQQAFDLACSHNQLGIIKYLFKHHKNCEINYLKSLQACAENDQLEIMDFLLLNFKDRTAKEPQKYQKLIASEFENLIKIAFEKKQKAMLKYLMIKKYKNPNNQSQKIMGNRIYYLQIFSEGLGYDGICEFLDQRLSSKFSEQQLIDLAWEFGSGSLMDVIFGRIEVVGNIILYDKFLTYDFYKYTPEKLEKFITHYIENGYLLLPNSHKKLYSFMLQNGKCIYLDIFKKITTKSIKDRLEKQYQWNESKIATFMQRREENIKYLCIKMEHYQKQTKRPSERVKISKSEYLKIYYQQSVKSLCQILNKGCYFKYYKTATQDENAYSTLSKNALSKLQQMFFKSMADRNQVINHINNAYKLQIHFLQVSKNKFLNDVISLKHQNQSEVSFELLSHFFTPSIWQARKHQNGIMDEMWLYYLIDHQYQQYLMQNRKITDQYQQQLPQQHYRPQHQDYIQYQQQQPQQHYRPQHQDYILEDTIQNFVQSYEENKADLERIITEPNEFLILLPKLEIIMKETNQQKGKNQTFYFHSEIKALKDSITKIKEFLAMIKQIEPYQTGQLHMAMLFQDEELDTNNYTNNMIQDIFDFLF